MTSAHSNFDDRQRRAGVRRTAWIVAGVAVAMYLLFFLKQAFWH
jgi:hypothetical protein